MSRQSSLDFEDYFLQNLPIPDEFHHEVLMDLDLITPDGALTQYGKLMFQNNVVPSVMRWMSIWKNNRNVSALGMVYMILCLGREVNASLHDSVIAYVHEEDCIEVVRVLCNETTPQFRFGPWEDAIYLAGLPCPLNKDALVRIMVKRTLLIGSVSRIAFVGDFWDDFGDQESLDVIKGLV